MVFLQALGISVACNPGIEVAVRIATITGLFFELFAWADSTVPQVPSIGFASYRSEIMVTYIKSDLEFILDQIRIAEAHADGTPLIDLVPNVQVPFGLRTVDGSFNNLVTGQEAFG